MKGFLFSLILAIGCLLATAPDTQAQTLLPTANKIIYTTNAVEVQDSVKKISYNLKKGTMLVVTKGFTGGTATILDAASRQTIWRGAVSTIRIVGVANSDSLKVLSLKTTPF